MPPAKLGPFEVLRELGAGGVGVVYAVKEPLTGRALALKLLHDEGRDATALERFEREAEVLARVHHRSVVRVHKTGRLREGSYLLQALVEGESLKATVARGPLAPRRAAELARELADALVAVHAAGVLHRDLKPANVLLQPDGIPVLLDFGIARDQTAERLTRTGTLLGSASYMAPEQANGDSPTSLDARVDVYGLGATLYELLVGEPPFTGTSLEVLQAVLSRDPPWPRSRRPEVPAALDAIVRAAMAKEREGRYRDAAALRDDLARFLADERPAGAPPARPGRLALAAGLALVAALAVAVGLAVVAATRVDPAPPSPASDAPAAVATRAPPPAAPAAREDPAPLWDVRPGEPIDLVVAYEESDDQALVTFEGLLRLTPGAAADGRGRVPIEVELRAVEIGLGSPATGVGARYDTRDPTPGHPLAPISAAIGGRLACTLEPRTGRVEVLAGPPIAARVDMRAFGTIPMVEPLTIKQAMRSLLANEFFSRFLDGALHVREAPLPWTQAPERPDGGLEFLLAPKDSLPRVVPSALEPALKAKTPARVTGRTLYRAGRPREATLTQLDERGKGRGEGQARWSLRLDAP